MSNYSGTSLESRVLTAIQAVDSNITSLSNSSKDKIHNQWNYNAWLSACQYAKQEDSNKVTEGTLNNANTTFFPMTISDLGIDHFKTDMRDVILSGNCVMPYYGMIPKQGDSTGFETTSRVTVFLKNKCFKFDKDYPSYFRAVRDGVHHYFAQAYFVEEGETNNSNSALSNGNDYYDNNKLTA